MLTPKRKRVAQTILTKNDMKEITKNSLGFQVPVNVYESFEEADRAAEREGAALEETNNNLYYRGAAVEVRELVAEAVEKLTGVPRETKPVMKKAKDEQGNDIEVQAKDADGNDAFEYVLSEAKYVEKALAESGKDIGSLEPEIIAHVRSANDGRGVSVDIRKQERKPAGPKVLAKKWLDLASGAIGNPDKLAKFAKDYRKMVGEELSINGEDGQPDQTKLGWAIKRFIDTKMQKAQDEFAV